MQGHRHSMVVPLHILSASSSCRSSENPMDSFGSRLRYERERRQIALKSIAESTKISVALLEGLERDDVSRWPSGIFRKSFIRSYAEAIGLPPSRSSASSSNGIRIRSRPTSTPHCHPRAVQQAPGPQSHLNRRPLDRRHPKVLSRSSSPLPGADLYNAPLEDWRIGRLSECCGIDE